MTVSWVVKTKTQNDARWIEARIKHGNDELILTMLPTDAIRLAREIVMAILDLSVDDVFAMTDAKVAREFERLMQIAADEPSRLDVIMRED